MKSTVNMRKNAVAIVFCLFACFFCATCGLETIVVLNEPTINNQQNETKPSEDPQYWYCDFRTQDNSGVAGADYLGTGVYYKIYNNYSDLLSQKNSINSVNSSSNNVAAAKRMIETYTYQPLSQYPSVKNSSVFVDYLPTSNVRFRLKTYKNMPENDGNAIYLFQASIAYPHDSSVYTYYCYDDSDKLVTYEYDSVNNIWREMAGEQNEVDYSDLKFVIPWRTRVGDGRSFDFFDDKNTNAPENSEPEEGDIDYYCNKNGFSSEYDNTYFVQLYAVAVALDQFSLSNTYSLVLDLGIIPIKKDE